MSPGPDTRRDRWSAAGLAVFAVVYLLANRRYPLDTLATPGPGLFPLAAGLALLLLAGWQVITRGRRPEPPAEAVAVPGPGRRASLVMGGLLMVYAASLGVLGFFAASAALVFVAARLMGAPGWSRPAALALGVTVAGYVIFVAWLGVPLPAGAFR